MLLAAGFDITSRAVLTSRNGHVLVGFGGMVLFVGASWPSGIAYGSCLDIVLAGMPRLWVGFDGVCNVKLGCGWPMIARITWLQRSDITKFHQ